MSAIIAWLIQGALVAAVTTLVVRIVPPGAAARRHLIWWLALVVILVCPFIDVRPPTAMAGQAQSAVAAVDAARFILPMAPGWLVMMLSGVWVGLTLTKLCRLLLCLRSLEHLLLDSSPLDAARVARFV